jgi:hypothetical protein
MSGRRVLVIGSQCNALQRLSFLPEVAARFHALMMAPGPGECLGAEVGDPPGLLLDPTVAQAKAAIMAAYDAAANAGDILILAYIGHGKFALNDFFLMPTDAANPPNSEGAIHLAQIIKHRPLNRLKGLVVLLDTCDSGAGAWDAVEYWVRSLEGQLPFEALTATDDGSTANAWFTKSLIQLLEQGDSDAPNRLRCENARAWVREAYPQLAPQLSAHNTGEFLYLGRNITKDPGNVFWKDSPGRTLILEQTHNLQPTAELQAIVEASKAHSIVVVTGDAGVGKSTLAAALVRPELTGGIVPNGFSHAIALLNVNTNLRSLAVDLKRQLERSVSALVEGVAEFERRVAYQERSQLDLVALMVLKPMEHLPNAPEVRIVIDAFNQLPDSLRTQVRDSLAHCPPHVRLVITSRESTPDCPIGYRVTVDRADRRVVADYLESRHIPRDCHEAVLDRADDNWLIARLLADALHNNPDLDLERLPNTVVGAYELLLNQAGASEGWTTRFATVLGPLAAAGSGPVLPLRLLVYACSWLGGPSADDDVLAILRDLRGLVTRRDVESPDEHAGLFHPTFAEYLFSEEAAAAGFSIDPIATHKSLTEAIRALAPLSGHKRDDPLYRYAFIHEAEHLWVAGQVEEAVLCLNARKSNTPRENLDLLRWWLPSIGEVLGEDHPATLMTRNTFASWTGQAGYAREALHLFTALLADCERVLGPDHPDTLTIRNNIAVWTDQSGDAAKALRLDQLLLADRVRVLGVDHPHTLMSRSHVASLTGKVGNPHEALRLFKALLSDRHRILGVDHPDTLLTRNNIAHWTGITGNPHQALHLFTSLLPDQQSILGADHPETLRTLRNIAHWTGETGDVRKAVRLHLLLLHDHYRVLGKEHPYSMRARNNLAHWTRMRGDFQRALCLSAALLRHQERLLGASHPDTLVLRNNVAELTGMVGNAQEALRLLVMLLPELKRVLGENHPDTLTTRNNIAGWTGNTGDAQEALWLFTALLPDRERVLGRDHPDTLTTRANIAFWTGQTGDAREALRLFKALLPDQERVLGRDHPDTLTILESMGIWSFRNGDPVGGCRYLREGFARAESRFGTEHPVTRRFQNSIQTFGCGEPGPDAPLRPRLG